MIIKADSGKDLASDPGQKSKDVSANKAVKGCKSSGIPPASEGSMPNQNRSTSAGKLLQARSGSPLSLRRVFTAKYEIDKSTLGVWIVGDYPSEMVASLCALGVSAMNIRTWDPRRSSSSPDLLWEERPD